MTKDILTKRIEKNQSKVSDEIRDYIGASSIGSECLRQIWYQYKGVDSEDVPVKMRRTWAIGKHLESLILDWLEDTGIETSRLWWDLKSANNPDFRGHVDSVWLKKDEAYAIIEVKTAKNASFNIFVKKGLRIWNPQYYAQIQSYMGMSEIYRAYILVLNKDNSALSDESVLFDAEYYSELENKSLMISQANIEPPRINGSPLYYMCKMCKYNKICHK